MTIFQYLQEIEDFDIKKYIKELIVLIGIALSLTALRILILFMQPEAMSSNSSSNIPQGYLQPSFVNLISSSFILMLIPSILILLIYFIAKLLIQFYFTKKKEIMPNIPK